MLSVDQWVAFMDKGRAGIGRAVLFIIFAFAMTSPMFGQDTPDATDSSLPPVEVTTESQSTPPKKPPVAKKASAPKKPSTTPVAAPQTSELPLSTEAADMEFLSPPAETTSYVLGTSKSELSADVAASPASVTSVKYSEETTRNITGYEDLLKPVAGVAANNFDQGPGVGFGLTLRGFTERSNGGNVALFVDGVPINQPSHQFTNGYGDLFPLIPELIDSFVLVRGPFDVRAGAHALAGSAYYTTADLPTSGATVSGGSYENARALGVYNFGTGAVRGYGSLVAETTNGYLDNSGWDQVNTFNKFNFAMPDGKGSVSFQVQETDYDSPGFINRNLIRNGTISERTARNPTDGGNTALQSLVFNYKQNSDQPFSANAYVIHTDNNRFASFQAMVTIPVPGDTAGVQTLQQDDRVTTGGAVEKYFRSDLPAGMGIDLLVGTGVKASFVEQDEFNTTAQQIVSRREDLDFSIINPFGYVQSNFKPFEWLKLTGGVRYDQLYYDIEGLANTNFNVDVSADVFVVQPKAGITVTPIRGLGLDFFANYGEGFRPPAANGTTELTSDPSVEEATIESKEIGVQFNSANGVWHFLASYYETEFTNELLGQGQGNPPIPLGASLRDGFDVEGRVRIYHSRRTTASIYASYSEQDGRLTETAPGASTVPEIADYLFKYGFDLTTPVGGEFSPHFLHLSAGQVWEGPKALNTTNTLTTETFSRIDAKISYTNEDWKGFSAFLGAVVYPDGRLDETAFVSGGQVGVAAKAPVTVIGGVFVPF
ncbi:MAG: hypothetical protein CTY31_13795 [Hyphomicrobium sp.]|nr:MAG: hypothetical protein CTY39_07560 [Hyphomicrobium sp.]PPC98271.1 MAG: hypothetical protein CTY31_13795 [Hyphomicrobium sp.]